MLWNIITILITESFKLLQIILYDITIIQNYTNMII